MPYWDLKSFKQATIIFDFTEEFVSQYLAGSDYTRRRAQLTEAARSGKQNIAEGCTQSKNKPKSEHFLLNIASASLKELLEDYQDFLRQRGLAQWGKDDPRAQALRRLAYVPDKTDRSEMSYKSDRSDKTDRSYKNYQSYLAEPERAANAMITLINQTTYLLDQQIKAVTRQLQEKGIELETQSQKILKSRNQNKKQETDFWQTQKQSGSVRLKDGRFTSVKDLSIAELDNLDFDEEWLSREQVSKLWHKFHKKE